MNSFPLEFLWWFHLVGFFRDDMHRTLRELGASEDIACTLSSPLFSDTTKNADVLGWWRSFCKGREDEVSAMANKYIAYYYQKWKQF